MQFDGNIYKKEFSERITELSTRRNNIERYLRTRYEMNPQFATKVADILEKTSLIDNLLNSGMYDSVIETVVQQLTQRENSSFSEAKHIKKKERDEHLYSQQTTSSQSQNNLPQQNTTPLSEEQKKEPKTDKQQYIEQLQEAWEELEQKYADMRSRRSNRR